MIESPRLWTNKDTPLYKFVSRETGKLVLKNRSLRWSRPGRLNDPHDNQFHLLPSFDYAEAKRLGLDKLWETHYGDGPIDPRNELGSLIGAFRGRFPFLSREEFVATFGPAFDEVFSSMSTTVERFNVEVQEQIYKQTLVPN